MFCYITFQVFGTPQPQGSARAFMPKGAKFPVVTSDNPKLKPWRQEVAQVAQLEMNENNLEVIGKKHPTRIEAEFYFAPPKSGRNLVHKMTRPDVDKLSRALLDALTGIVYEDDGQVSQCEVRKFFGAPARVVVMVKLL
jgi:crossover junction endodeoxyribonuclease RusA